MTKVLLPHMKSASHNFSLPFIASNSSDLFNLTAISPVDGRYQQQIVTLQNICSEGALIRWRVYVEIAWFKTMLQITAAEKNWVAFSEFLDAIVEKFSLEDATRIKNIEISTKHDVKAVEYFIKEKIAVHQELYKYRALIHCGATSDDINNLAYALMLQEVRTTCLLPQLDNLIAYLTSLAHVNAKVAMLARTHGQSATPTTVGKELANFVARLSKYFTQLTTTPICGKFNGATGNYNALYVAYPEYNWRDICQSFVTQLGITFNPYTTQIEPHDYIANFCHILSSINTILLDLCRDMWGYIAINYFVFKRGNDNCGCNDGSNSSGSNGNNNDNNSSSTRYDRDAEFVKEIGSSTMPHKINPIDFENAEGNLGLANALFYHFASKLPISRWQRDLSDSTVMRNLGVGFAYSLLAYQALRKGLSKIMVNHAQLAADLELHWEVLGEAIQMVMRRYGIDDAYEQLKALTRGRNVDKQILQEFIQRLPISEEARKNLLALTPHSYIGKAAVLAEEL